ncbi:alpha-ketoacid dehydrogenase subunit beta [Vagococcus entomophilus]|uniref:Alpha-ketoacid dehydrogenase subunit beta n=1 Tax=Vagococcus entomophilus TaxID=1160095 RepID=A0A430AI48_9ENTE|nr:alpha-ketoacid dehydrogenase subunit beta [Vagococcus entomophilus]RSU07796.1 alpha-ketoacid dehydrogenase subunit beta [Vagococcus entomophilus]
MRRLTYLEAVNEALDEALGQDKRVFLMGEDIGIYGGGFGATKGLEEKYGAERVRSTPISESAIVGLAVGASMTGMKPVVELQFSDFITIAMDQLVNQAAKIHYMSNGQFQVPLVVRTPGGSGTGAGAQHSQSLENWLAHIPGLKVIQPATAYDAKGLLHAAISDNNPVVIYEHKLCYPLEAEVPEGRYTVPIGQADIKRSGEDITVVATGIMVIRALEAAEKLANQGVSVEVVDPRTLFPLDKKSILQSVKKTKRVLLVTEAVLRSSFASELSAVIAESDVFYELKQPIERLGGKEVPIPCAKNLESLAVPKVQEIEAKISHMLFKNDKEQTIEKPR